MGSLVHVDNNPQYNFKFENFLKSEYSFALDPDRPVCEYYNYKEGESSCPRGRLCDKKHVLANFQNKIVCKHWLRGLCKKNDQCEYLHEYNLRKMPECVFYSKNGYCTQTPECQYLHIDTLPPKCEDYEVGFCAKGPGCPRRHVRNRRMCQRYLNGFCPLGSRQCEHYHHTQYLPLSTALGRYTIKRDDEINTRKMDEEKERRLNAIINGELLE